MLVAEHVVASSGVCQVQGVGFTQPTVTLAQSVGAVAESAVCTPIQAATKRVAGIDMYVRTQVRESAHDTLENKT